MKQMMTASLLALAFTTAQAQTDESVQFCTQMAGMADSIMDARQAGVSMDKMYGVSSGNEEVDKMARLLVRMSFAKPQMYTNDAKARMVSEFRSDTFARCIEARKNK